MMVSPQECAHDVLETVPLIMRTIRTEMRNQRDADLTVPEFRTLTFIARHEDASPSQVAEHLGLTLPSMTHLVDGLVERGLVVRQPHHRDRRRLILSLTPLGDSTVQMARAAAQAALANKLTGLSTAQLETVTQAMRILRPIFTSSQAAQTIMEM